MQTHTTNDCPVPKGVLLIIGGHENKGSEAEDAVEKANNNPTEILQTFVDLLRKKDARVEVITTAGEDGNEAFKEYKKVFKKLGLEDVGHIHHEKRRDVLNDDLEDRLKAADGFFFSGGDQLKLTSIYGGTNFLLQLKQRYIRSKVVLAGTSAGAMAFSTPMIFAGNLDKQQLVGGVKISVGLEFLKDVCIDTHFVDRSRSVRMSQVVAMNPTCIGIGIEEDTALILEDGNKISVIGSGTVTVIEGFRLEDSNILEYDQDKCISVDGLTERLIAKGGTYLVPRINPPHA